MQPQPKTPKQTTTADTQFLDTTVTTGTIPVAASSSTTPVSRARKANQVDAETEDIDATAPEAKQQPRPIATPTPDL